MSRTDLELPIIQNWSCHNCGGCCREHQIDITQEEKKRIDRQNWTAADGVPADRPLMVRTGGGDWRLGHAEDGACVFLNDQGLCRIHAKFGEAAKPLACRVYPYAFHPHDRNVTVSLRFSCPSVVQNLGENVEKQDAWLKQIAREILDGKQKELPPPPVHGDQQLDWSDTDLFLDAFDSGIADTTVNFATRLMRILSWLELIEQSQFSTVRGQRLAEMIRTLTRAAARAQPDSNLPVVEPQRIGRTMFRQIVAHLLRHDTHQTIRGGLRERLRLLMEGIRFTMGRGRVPVLPDPISVRRVFGSHSGEGNDRSTASRPLFSDVEGPFQGRTNEIDELMTRYFRVKIQGLHFCGAANFQLSLVDGFRSLALMYPAALWVARIRAASHGRDHVTLTDVQASLATLDHNYAYSPVFATASAKNRLTLLARAHQITSLCGWYSL